MQSTFVHSRGLGDIGATSKSAKRVGYIHVFSLRRPTYLLTRRQIIRQLLTTLYCAPYLSRFGIGTTTVRACPSDERLSNEIRTSLRGVSLRVAVTVYGYNYLCQVLFPSVLPLFLLFGLYRAPHLV